MPLLPRLTFNQPKQNTNLSFKLDLVFIFSTNAAKPHSCGDKDIRNKFPVVMSRQDNIKTKDSSQIFIFEDFSWDIFLSHNRYTLSE